MDSHTTPKKKAEEDQDQKEIELENYSTSKKLNPEKNGNSAKDGDKKDGKTKDGKKDEKELTEEEKKAKAARFVIANAKAKELLKGLAGQFKGMIAAGVVLNILGMGSELASPLFVGYIIDAIIKQDS